MPLDPKTNRIEREQQKAIALLKRDKPLNSNWPYLRISFDPFFFSATVDPKPVKSPNP